MPELDSNLLAAINVVVNVSLLLSLSTNGCCHLVILIYRQVAPSFRDRLNSLRRAP